MSSKGSNSHEKSIKTSLSGLYIDKKGFTLLEVLVALTIFSVGLLGIAGMQVTAITTNSSSNTRSVQTDVAASILEEILTWPASSFSDTADTAWVFNAGDDTVLSGGTYTASYTIDVDYNGINNLIFVEVTAQQINGFQRIYKATGYKRGS